MRLTFIVSEEMTVEVLFVVACEVTQLPTALEELNNFLSRTLRLEGLLGFAVRRSEKREESEVSNVCSGTISHLQLPSFE